MRVALNIRAAALAGRAARPGRRCFTSTIGVREAPPPAGSVPHPASIKTREGFTVTAPWEHMTRVDPTGDYMLPHAVYTDAEVRSIKQTHFEPQGVRDRVALRALKLVRGTFDAITGYSPGKMTGERYLTRMIFLESVAGVPGMVSAMIRHLHSLRLMKRDHGWISTLLGEAENERMHLLTFMQMRDPKPGVLFRGAVLGVQGIFTNFYFLAYLVAPSACHRFVGFLEEEAVHTYTNAIKELEEGKLPEWADKPAPPIAISYWRMKPDAKILDLLLAVRSDEAIHRDVNHVLAGLDKEAGENPFKG